ncbi:hypothetical protein RDI58_014792 [Solanum bulbocastanum]|uniref:START domain-containing protein n=1 Tax=Solanum bulbocastanum TaxID=147425 RepID=A0AAN8YBC6_SOLBU
MEDHTNTSDRRESLVNLMRRGPREDQNENNFFTNNRDGGASGDELNSLHGISHGKFNCDPCYNKDTIRNRNIDEKEILNEHAHLKYELTRIAIHADKFLGPSTFLEGSLTSMMENFGLELLMGRDETSVISVVDDLSLNEVDFEKYLSNPLSTNLVNKDFTLDKSVLLNFSLDALNEFLKLAMSDESFWVRSLDGGGEILNIEEYARSFISIIHIKPSHFTTEATRSFGTVIGNVVILVEMLMNDSQWVDTFPCIIIKVNTFDVISTGIGESKIGTWIIVDVCVDTIKEGSQQYKIEKCRRLHSACIIQDVSNGYSKVIWIEHMEYDEIFVHHLYRPFIRAGLGFGAQRWISSLQRQSEFLRVIATFVDFTDTTGSPLVYAIVDSSKMNIVMKWGESSCVELLPNGISIVPDLPRDNSATINKGGNNNEFCSGSLVTIRFQMSVGNLSTTDLPEKSIIEENDIISHTIHKIKTTLTCK